MTKRMFSTFSFCVTSVKFDIHALTTFLLRSLRREVPGVKATDIKALGGINALAGGRQGYPVFESPDRDFIRVIRVIKVIRVISVIRVIRVISVTLIL
jgi:hypothetical protein